MVGLTTKARFPPRYGLRGPLFIAIAAVAVIAIALCLDSAAIVAVQQIPSGVKAAFAWLSYLSEPLLVLSAIACGLTVTGLLPSNIGQPALTVVFRFFGLCLVSSLLSLFVVFVGKALIGRARPLASTDFDPLLFQPLAGIAAFESFPSAQAAVAAAICHCAVSSFPGSRGAALAAMVIIGFSRVVTERHWPSDVIAGWLIGWLGAALVVALFSHRQRGRSHGF